MTLRQIAELREASSAGRAYIACILDEREALLLALKELMSRTPLTDEELDARVRLAYKAIEKAESPCPL